MSLLDALQERILIGDGAMSTLLFSHGVDCCFEELCLRHPEEIFEIHRSYVKAGTDVIQTNTYRANYIKLSRYGLEEQVKNINSAAVRIAKEAANEETFVLGTIGGIHGGGIYTDTKEELKRSFREQLYCLLLEDVDGLLLETYYDFEELTTVLEIARAATELPIVAHVSIYEPGILQNGVTLFNALQHLEDIGADVVGVNCRLGPHHMLKALETVAVPKNAYLSVYPNASLPEYREGTLVYKKEPEYFTKYARDFRNEGARLIGGCCGTTPEHIKALAEGIKGLKPLQEKQLNQAAEQIEVIPLKPNNGLPLVAKVKQRHSIIVELDPPKHLNTKKFFDGAYALKKAGIDAITLADNSLATPRISNMAIATRLKDTVGIRPLVHLTCRDRNLIGLQSHLMGLHTLGITELLAVTGDPAKVGDFPGATSVYDVSSMELIQLIKQFNEGLSLSGKSLGEKTHFHVGAAFNPNVRHLHKAVQRLERKIKHGADYFMTQPVFSAEKIIDVSEATKHIEAPIYIGIMPLTSIRNAEFLHNEVPGIRLTADVLKRMNQAAHRVDQSVKEGLAIAKELIDVAIEHFNGIYLITPFMRFELTVELASYINNKTKKAFHYSR